jgi:amidohydrolase
MIHEKANTLASTLIDLRRDFHMHPELGFEETRTASVIETHLKALNLAGVTPMGGTGLCGLLKGSAPGRCIAIRADMDALPVQEMKDSPYKSVHEGKMHACGHDVHMSCVLGAAMILAELRDHIRGAVKFIFQPGEEVLPGGARSMITAGIMNNPPVDAIIALHTDPQTESGKLALKKGPLMAGADIFTVRVTGKGGHGALPHLVNDTIVAASETIIALQTLVSRQIDPLSPAVLSVGAIHGGTAFNVLPEEVAFKGTVRALDGDVLKKFPGNIRRVVEQVSAAHGCRAELDYTRGVPVVVNDGDIIDVVKKAAITLFGEGCIENLENPVMGGEDFACYLEKARGAMVWLGVRNEEKDAVYSWHSPRFDIDEDAIAFGAAILCAAAVDYLDIYDGTS